jgi:hypothetical protein
VNGTMQQKQRKGGTTRGRLMKTAVAAGVASLAPTAVNTVPAEGTVVNVNPAHNITVFANIDFVATFGHGAADNLTVEVRRNGVVIGTATGEVFAEDPAAPDFGLEVNHGPEGAPVAGDCWQSAGGANATPDIRAGDRVRVIGPSGTDTVIVDDLAYQGRPRELRNGDIVVPFRAYRANGRPIAPSFIDSAEFRAEANNSVRFEGRRAVRVERRPGAKPGQLWQRYQRPFRPARNDDENPFNQAELRRALLGDGHATGFGHVEVLPREAMLVDGLGDAPGPAIGCTGASAQWEVGSVSPKTITRANRTRLFKATGRTFDATRVDVRLVDRDAGEPVRVVEKRATVNGNRWNVSFRPGQLSRLDGQFRVSSLHTLTGETARIGGPGKFATRNLR